MEELQVCAFLDAAVECMAVVSGDTTGIVLCLT